MDDRGCIIGKVSGKKRIHFFAGEGGEREIAFCGIHVLSSEIFDYFPEEEFFDIFSVYFEAVRAGKRVLGWNVGNVSWKDAGKFDRTYR